MVLAKWFLVFLIIPCLLISCKKDSEKGQPDVPYFFEISFNQSDTIRINEGENGYQSGLGRGDGRDSTGTYFERQSTTFSDGTIKNKLTIYFIQAFTDTPARTEVESMFHEGDYAFGKSYVSPFINGVEIVWVDSLDTEWWSSKRIQTGNHFTVTKHEANSYDNFSPFVTSGHFNCALFNDTGDSIWAVGTFLTRTVKYITE